MISPKGIQKAYIRLSYDLIHLQLYGDFAACVEHVLTVQRRSGNRVVPHHRFIHLIQQNLKQMIFCITADCLCLLFVQSW